MKRTHLGIYVNLILIVLFVFLACRVNREHSIQGLDISIDPVSFEFENKNSYLYIDQIHAQKVIDEHELNISKVNITPVNFPNSPDQYLIFNIEKNSKSIYAEYEFSQQNLNDYKTIKGYTTSNEFTLFRMQLFNSTIPIDLKVRSCVEVPHSTTGVNCGPWYKKIFLFKSNEENDFGKKLVHLEELEQKFKNLSFDLFTIFSSNHGDLSEELKSINHFEAIGPHLIGEAIKKDAYLEHDQIFDHEYKIKNDECVTRSTYFSLDKNQKCQWTNAFLKSNSFYDNSIDQYHWQDDFLCNSKLICNNKFSCMKYTKLISELSKYNFDCDNKQQNGDYMIDIHLRINKNIITQNIRYFLSKSLKI